MTTLAIYSTLLLQSSRSHSPKEWRALAAQYEAAGDTQGAALCHTKRKQENRRIRAKREDRIRRDTLGDMFPDGVDDGFSGVESND